MNKLARKTKKISFRIGLRLGVESIALLTVLVLFIGTMVRRSLRDEFVNSVRALVRSGVTVMNQQNHAAVKNLHHV